MTSTAPALTGLDRRIIAEAREVAGVRTRDICEYTGQDSLGMAYAVAFGRAQWRMSELLRLVGRLAGEAEDAAAQLEGLPGHECSGACAEVGG